MFAETNSTRPCEPSDGEWTQFCTVNGDGPELLIHSYNLKGHYNYSFKCGINNIEEDGVERYYEANILTLHLVGE